MKRKTDVAVPMAYVGIDLGKSGGIAVVGSNGEMIDLYDMPDTAEEQVEELHNTINELEEAGYKFILIGMEQTSAHPGEGVVSVRSFAINCGGIFYTSLLLSKLWDNIIVSRIPPVLWKKHFELLNPKLSKYDKKKLSVDYVNSRFNMSLKYNKNGLSDALLIAHYLREENIKES